MKRLVLTFVLAVIAMGQVSGATINLATGLDTSNSLLTTNGVADAHWTVRETGDSAQVNTPLSPNWYSGWIANGPNSAWISRNAGTLNNDENIYDFTFDLTGYNLSTVSMLGSWTIDDQGTLKLNGNLIDSLGIGQWNALHSFSVTDSSLFNQGMNTLSIDITWADNAKDAVRLEGLVSGTQVPEPTSLVLWAGLGVMGLIAARRRKKS